MFSLKRWIGVVLLTMALPGCGGGGGGDDGGGGMWGQNSVQPETTATSEATLYSAITHPEVPIGAIAVGPSGAAVALIGPKDSS